MPSDLLHDLIEMIDRMQAKRVVIDSLSGFELAVAPEFHEDFRGSLYRMIAELTAMGVTVLMTVEVSESLNELRLSPDVISFLTDDIVLQRYVEIEGQLKRMMTVVKMRRSGHSQDIRSYEITSSGLTVGETLKGYQGIISGIPTQSDMRHKAGL